MPTKSVPPEWIRNPSDELAVTQGCYFDEDLAASPIRFIERICKQSKGRWAGQPLLLLEWQRDLLSRLFGWRRADGRRRFRRAYIEVAKKNGKSTLVSGLSLFMLIADDDGPEIYINACDRDQASMVFDEAARMVRSSPGLSKRLDVVDSRKIIAFREKNGRVRANSSESPSKDGLNPSCIIFDELHRQPDRELWEVFEYAGGAREQPLTISITTAGESEDGVWFEQREYSEKVNRGEIPDTTHLGVVYRADPADDLDDPVTWRKANPSLGHTIREEDFSRELAEAKELPVKLAAFKRLKLNIVSRSTGLFISPETWGANATAPRPLPDLKGAACYAGLDLSATLDLTALVALFPEGDFIDVHCWFWLPEDNIVALERRDRVPYRAWADAGFLTLTPGEVVDYEFVRREIVAISKVHNLRKLLCDPWRALDIATKLREHDGLPIEYIRQGYQSLCSPTTELQRLAMSSKLRHGNHPILRWNAGNAVAESDAAGNLKLSKKKSRQKIDGMAALVNAISALTAGGDTGPSVYETRGLLYL